MPTSPQNSASLSPLNFSAVTPGAVTLHAASGIISVSLFGTTNSEWTTGRIDGLDYDTLLLSRGNNYPCYGSLDGESFRIEPHGILLISFIPQGVKGELTYYRAVGTSSLLMFPPGRLANMMMGDRSAARIPFAMIDCPRMVELFQLIETEILAPDERQSGYIETLTRMIADCLSDRSSVGHMWERARLDISPQTLKRVLGYVEDHLGEPIDLNAMAAVAGLSRYYFVAVFKRATGRSPYQHLLSRRIARAQTLIAQSDDSLSEIAKASGFTSPSQFSSSFRRETGFSPTRYRELVRQGVDTLGGDVVAP